MEYTYGSQKKVIYLYKSVSQNYKSFQVTYKWFKLL